MTGIGTCTDIVIPNTYNNKLVTSVGDSAFYNCNGLKNLAIPNSVTSIENETFYYCDNLEYNIYDNGKYLGNENNPYLYLIKPISKNITTCAINDNCKFTYEYAFFGCISLTSLTTPDSVISIGGRVFSSCKSLTSIVIPDRVTSIGRNAFENCSNLTKVYCNGSKNDWNNITIGSSNYNLTLATRYYYSETKQSLNDDETTYNGNYWHYGTDGKTIIEWIK